MKKVIIADDEAGVANILRECVREACLIRHIRADVDTVPNGEELVNRVTSAEKRYDLVLVDHNMGAGITGLEAVAQIRQFDPIAPIYLTSGDEIREEALKVKATGFIQKLDDYTFEKIEEIVEKHLKG